MGVLRGYKLGLRYSLHGVAVTLPPLNVAQASSLYCSIGFQPVFRPTRHTPDRQDAYATLLPPLVRLETAAIRH